MSLRSSRSFRLPASRSAKWRLARAATGHAATVTVLLGFLTAHAALERLGERTEELLMIRRVPSNECKSLTAVPWVIDVLGDQKGRADIISRDSTDLISFLCRRHDAGSFRDHRAGHRAARSSLVGPSQAPRSRRGRGTSSSRRSSSLAREVSSLDQSPVNIHPWNPRITPSAPPHRPAPDCLRQLGFTARAGTQRCSNAKNSKKVRKARLTGEFRA